MSRKPLGQEVSEEDVLNAAKKIFCEYGFDNTNLNDIARELNTTRTPIYYYFENKQNLYEAVVKKHLTGKLETYTELFASDMPFFDKVRKDLDLSSHLRLAEKELFTGINSKPQLAAARDFQTDIMHRIHKMKTQYIQKAIDDKILRPDTDVESFMVYFYVISLGIEAVDKQDGWYDMTEARISRLIDTVLDAIMLRYKALCPVRADIYIYYNASGKNRAEAKSTSLIGGMCFLIWWGEERMRYYA